MSGFSQADIDQAKRVIQRFKVKKTKTEVFYNFCFCILVPQARFSTILSVINRLQQANYYARTIHREELLNLILDVRFKNRKVDYLQKLKYEFDDFWPELNGCLQAVSDTRAKRSFIVNRIKGMGLKAASHFLRNLGFEDLAIVDTHILKYLNITFKNFDYFKIEDELRARASKLNLSVAILDAIIWCRQAKVKEKDFVF